ncbi:hypothetical protein BDV59DRAFT_167321 [Aspergillus ambiguus]|uniref:uncharacterized protein n=1 Tax=Aspergillus ambiguus TaxID=176160 RepID=UPI003CCCB959
MCTFSIPNFRSFHNTVTIQLELLQDFKNCSPDSLCPFSYLAQYRPCPLRPIPVHNLCVTDN